MIANPRHRSSGLRLNNIKAWKEFYAGAINKVEKSSNWIAKNRMDLMKKVEDLWNSF